jgi:kinesin family protein 4/21/27
MRVTRHAEGAASCVAVSHAGGEPLVSLTSGVSYAFDHAFGGCGGAASTHAPLFAACVRPLVDGCIDGFNATVLAFGQTGSGKTHTMGTGAGAGEGVVPAAMVHLFERLQAGAASGELTSSDVGPCALRQPACSSRF